MKKQLLLSFLTLLLCLSSKAQWSTNSAINNLVSATVNDQLYPKIIRDGLGGYIIAWSERAPNDFNVFAQKIDSNGTRLWGPDGIAVCSNPNHQMFSGLCSDGAGGAIIVWEDSTGTGGGGSYGDNDIFAQRVSAAGVKMWTANGVSIGSAIDIQGYVNIVSDNNNGAFITWNDYRNNGYLGSDIYGQRVNGAGVVQWTTDGKVICNATNPQVRPRICPDNTGGLFVVWEDYRFYSQSEIYFQRIDINGNPQYAANGLTACTAANDQLFPEIIADGTGGAFITWYDKRTLGNSGVGDLFGQRVNAAGTLLWGTAGLSLCNATGDQFASFANLPCMMLDGTGGFYYTWNDLRSGNHDVYLQRFNSSGAPQWTVNGIAVNNNTFNELYPSLASDGLGGVYVTWDRYNLAAVDVYGQRYNSSGTALWAANGIPLANASNSQYNNQLVSNPDGTAILVFNDKRSNTNFDIYAQKVTNTGVCIPPVMTLTATLSTICSGQSTTITANGAASYNWGALGTGSSKIVAPTTTTTYTVTGTNADGCSNTSTITINVNPIPTVAASASTTAVCLGSSTTLTASGASTYVWSNGSILASQVVSPTSTTTYTVTGTSSSGCSATTSISITVNSIPTITISPTVATICPGGVATLTASGASTYVWTNNSASGASQSFSPLVTTTYTVVGTSTNGCTASGTRIVNVNSTPPVVISPATATVCEGGSIVLTASGANSYVWTNLGSGASKTVTPTTTTVYTVTGTSSVGCTATATKMVTVNPYPVVTITPSTATTCSGQSQTLVASGADTYTWNIGGTASTQTVSPTITTTYTVTGTSLGCSATASATVTVNPLPALTITPTNAVICEGNGISLIASGAASYSWNNGVTTAGQFLSPLTTTTYTVTGTSANGCTATASRTIVVNPLPVITISPATATVCAGSSITLSASGANTYLWNSTLGGPVQTFTPTSTTTYTVTGTSVNGCVSTVTKVVTVNAVPVASISPASVSLCAGQTATLTANGATSYLWNTSANTASIQVSPSTTTTYTVTATGANGCTATSTRTVSVNALPAVSITPSTISICLGQSTNLTATGASTYVWNTNATTASIQVSPATTTTFTVTGTDANGCVASATRSVVVNALPLVSITPATVSICLGQSATLTANGASTYVWNTNATTATTQVSPTSTTTFTVTGTDANGCSASATRSVVVNALPTVSITPATVNICLGQSATLTANGASTYLWNTNATTATTQVSPTSTTTFTVTGTNANGCSASATRSVVVNPLPVINISTSANPICVGSSVTLTASGANSYSWNGFGNGSTITVTPTATTTYTVTGTNSGGCASTQTITIAVNPCSSNLTVKLFLQGYYLGNSQMNPALLNQGVGNSTTISDSITISVYGNTFPYTLLYSGKTLLNTNGTLSITIPNLTNNQVYIGVKHRNSVETWSANPVTLVSNTFYDFTLSDLSAYGNNLKLIDTNPNIYGIYSGDISKDGSVDAFDYILMDQDILLGNTGYYDTDLNGDGAVDAFDYIILDENILFGITISTP